MKRFLLPALMIYSTLLCAQLNQPKAAMFDGVVVIGFVDNGAFLNFTGPNIHLTKGHSRWMLSMFPSLRFKQDREPVKNAFVTPSLGFGIVYCYKVLALQIPFYYNPKTATENGSWHMGLGLGLRLNYMNPKE